jgi:outer membrane protein assembly factor BamB
VNGFALTMEQRGDSELVTCYEVATGQLVWSHAERTRHSTTLGGIGPRSTPTIDSGKVFTLGATGTLLCLDGATGEVLWRDNLLHRYGVDAEEDAQSVAWGRSASPLIVDELLVVPAGGPAAGPPVSLVAFEKDTGELLWEGGRRQVSFSSPTLATLAGVRQIISVNQDYVSGHDLRNGELLWETAWPGKSNADANVSQPVAISADHLFLSKGYGVGAALFQVTRDNSAFRLREIWRNNRVLKTKFTNVVVQDGYAYGLSDGILECVRLQDGRRQWKRGRYGHGQLLGVGDLLLVQTEAGQVAMVEASPARFHEIASLPALSGKTWNNPCLYKSYLLVRSAEEACCFELPSRSVELEN